MNTALSKNQALSAAADSQAGITDYELFLSCGGVTSVLGSVGTLLCCWLAGIRRFRRIYGASGGSIPAALTACGYTPKQLLHIVLEHEFSSYVDVKEGILTAPFKGILRFRSPISPELPDWRQCHWYGLLGTSKLGNFVQNLAEDIGVKGWPEGYMTMATTRYGLPVIFNGDGVFLLEDEKLTQLSSEPVPFSLAVRASGSIGGVMVPLAYKGWVLFDGGLSRDGFCPVGIPIRHFGAQPHKMIACRVNEVHPTTFMGKVHRLIRKGWWVHPDYHWGPESEGVLEIHPPIQHVGVLDLVLSADQKWLAILLAFQESAAMLALDGILAGDELKETQELIDSLGYWRDAPIAPVGKCQKLATRAQQCFAQHGLY